jgi:hypothetical protein
MPAQADIGLFGIGANCLLWLIAVQVSPQIHSCVIFAKEVLIKRLMWRRLSLQQRESPPARASISETRHLIQWGYVE